MARQCILLAVLLSALVGCVSTASRDIFTTEKIDGPREIAISGTRAPWVFEIEKRLRAKGISVKRWASQNRSIEQTAPDKVDVYSEASTRLILRIDGYAPNTSMTRCFGGGYDFEFVIAEVIDVENNETLAAYSNSGYSEGCQPLSGTIFEDVVSMVDAIFTIMVRRPITMPDRAASYERELNAHHWAALP